ncbi:MULTISPECIES: flagellar hook-basal body complex protein [unclassified Pseudomonas]|uniref:flagellar hook-basal body complex protein n=1 Tax=unclassified Pseudomonas TaxID=196821 RepID=UPI002ACB0D25|nr:MULTISPECIES: flagellar hook-basal body complex protein [unclassified Pseudomonas]MEB0041395.1 flagellar hook-basal body complex protein [Pseudomonas sp. MH10]MEB0093943.1 flagellar hook-basal body complex protein [Pseudomonas sp. CCI4.2]MEB0121190.1 flagellar hook-basal body complex protein [Pseudomonas sp. CCI1.2]WPX53627.1 flagellar hook-basal body complex protein [Pseudomonas sp. CCI4.2]WPX64263.1 flagellar hook-basal body complex protein [Pseudomonas sp. MH10]
MSFNVALNGLHAAHKRLEVASNNIANVGTHGFKSSRAEFTALYSGAMLGRVGNAVGDGVRLANVAQNFSQGEIGSSSERVLDLRIQGKGFFVVSDSGALSYTRAGAFIKDANDYIVDTQGSRLQGYGVNDKGAVVNGIRADLKINTGNMAAKTTSVIGQTINLDSSLPSLAALPNFNRDDPATYSSVLTKTIQDGGAAAVAEVKGKDVQGNEAVRVSATPAIAPADHELKQYFVKTDANRWTMYTLINGRHPIDPGTTSPLVATITKQPDGSISLVSEGDLIKKTSNTEFPLAGWTPSREVDGIWSASPAVNNGPIVLSLSEGGVNGLDEVGAVMSRSVPRFNAADITTFNKLFSTAIFDSLGNQHELTQHFVKDGTNSWKMHVLVSGRNPTTPDLEAPLTASLIFNADGSVRSMTGGEGLSVENNVVTLKSWVPARVLDAGKSSEKWTTNGAQGSVAGIAIDMKNLSQHNATTGRTTAQQDGYAAGQLEVVSIGVNGVIQAGFSNGQNKSIGQLMLATFANEQGLLPDSTTRWRETSASGMAKLDAPGSGGIGGIVSGSLEGSNVKLTDELVELIQAQTAYQANSKALSTEATLMQTLIQAI